MITITALCVPERKEKLELLVRTFEDLKLDVPQYVTNMLENISEDIEIDGERLGSTTRISLEDLPTGTTHIDIWDSE